MKFSDLNISKDFLHNLNSLNYVSLTKIQENTLLEALKNKDIIAQAKTGSGKTLAFSLPIINKLKSKEFKIQSLILAPTRELANQIAQSIKQLARHIHNIKILTLCGGVPFNPQVSSLRHNAHIVVATPGRLLKHILQQNIDLNYVNTFVLDEADKMLDMGFFEDIEKIVSFLPVHRQTMLFSATYEKNIIKLSEDICKNFIFVKIDEEKEEEINQKFYEVEKNEKTTLIPLLISQFESKSTIIFCNMKITCEKLADDLYNMGIDVLTLHSNLDQKQRDETIILFSNKSYPVLIATDVASRGIDIDDVDLVINYDLSLDEKIHTHRIGRTARAGKKGLAISFVCNEDIDKLNIIKEKFPDIKILNSNTIKDNPSFEINSSNQTIFINGGKKQKISKGDILGAFVKDLNFDIQSIGKINILDFSSYVVINDKKNARINVESLKIKGKYYKVYLK